MWLLKLRILWPLRDLSGRRAYSRGQREVNDLGTEQGIRSLNCAVALRLKTGGNQRDAHSIAHRVINDRTKNDVGFGVRVERTMSAATCTPTS